MTPEAEDYDPRKRDPQFARASASPLYELVRRFLQVLPVIDPVVCSFRSFIITTPPFPFMPVSCSNHTPSPRAQISHSTRSPISLIALYTKIQKSLNQRAQVPCSPLLAQPMASVSSESEVRSAVVHCQMKRSSGRKGWMRSL